MVIASFRSNLHVVVCSVVEVTVITTSFRSDIHVVLCLVVEVTVIRADSRVQMNVICRFQLILRVINGRSASLIVKVLVRMHQSFAPSVCFSSCFEQGGHASCFSRRILIMTF